MLEGVFFDVDIRLTVLLIALMRGVLLGVGLLTLMIRVGLALDVPCFLSSRGFGVIRAFVAAVGWRDGGCRFAHERLLCSACSTSAGGEGFPESWLGASINYPTAWPVDGTVGVRYCIAV
jgi:hypothetical protein